MPDTDLLNIERASAYAARYGIARARLEEALKASELPAGILPRGGWVIAASDLEAWVDAEGR